MKDYHSEELNVPKKPRSNTSTQRRERVSQLIFQGFNARQISEELHISHETILRDIEILKDQKKREYSETVCLYGKEPRKIPIKYQEIEDVNGKQVVVDKIIMVDENDRMKKLALFRRLSKISNHIHKLQGL